MPDTYTVDVDGKPVSFDWDKPTPPEAADLTALRDHVRATRHPAKATTTSTPSSPVDKLLSAVQHPLDVGGMVKTMAQVGEQADQAGPLPGLMKAVTSYNRKQYGGRQFYHPTEGDVDSFSLKYLNTPNTDANVPMKTAAALAKNPKDAAALKALSQMHPISQKAIARKAADMARRNNIVSNYTGYDPSETATPEALLDKTTGQPVPMPSLGEVTRGPEGYKQFQKQKPTSFLGQLAHGAEGAAYSLMSPENLRLMQGAGFVGAGIPGLAGPIAGGFSAMAGKSAIDRAAEGDYGGATLDAIFAGLAALGVRHTDKVPVKPLLAPESSPLLKEAQPPTVEEPQGVTLPSQEPQVIKPTKAQVKQAKAEKISKGTGMTPTQENFLASALREAVEKQPTTSVRGSNMPDFEQPVTIQVPDDGKFTVRSPLQAATLHKSVTGEAIPEWDIATKDVKKAGNIAPALRFGTSGGPRTGEKPPAGVPAEPPSWMNKQSGVSTAEPSQVQQNGATAPPPTTKVNKPSKPVEPSGTRRTATRNAVTTAERAERDMNPVEKQAYTALGSAYEQGKAAVDTRKTDPRVLAASVAEKPRVLTAEEVGVLGYDRARLINEDADLLSRADKTDVPAELDAIRQRREELQRHFDMNDQALQKGGREQSAAFNARKMEIGSDYSAVAMKQRAKVAKGSSLSDEQNTRIDQLSKDLADAQAKIQDFEGRKLVDGIEGRRVRRAQNRQDLDREYQELARSFAKKTTANLGFDPEQLGVVGRMAQNRVKAGVNTLDGIVDEVFTSLKEHIPGLTREDVHEAVSKSPPLEGAKARVQKQTADLEEKIRTGDISKPERVRLPQDRELINLVARRNATRRQYDHMVRALTPKTRGEKVAGAVNVARALTTSFDISAPGRQGIIGAMSHPVIAAKAFKSQIASLASPGAYEKVMAEIQLRPNAEKYRDTGLSLTEQGGKAAGREEPYQTEVAERIPFGIGRGVKASERAYSAFLNRMRADIFDAVTSGWEKSGVKYEGNEKQYQSLSTLINDMTGRGDLGSLNKHAPLFNAGLFSPRFVASRIRLLNPARYVLSPKGVRKELITSMSKFVGAGMVMLHLAKQEGAEVEDDPRSSDFGKIKVGNTRYDIWGGEQQYVRFFVQMSTRHKKSLSTGEMSSLTEPKYGQPNRLDHAITFARAKAAPAPAFLMDALAGKNVVGEKVDLADWREYARRFLPMWMNDMSAAMKEHGYLKGGLMASPAILGVGVQTFDAKAKK